MTDQERDNRRLVQRYQDGDESAFETLLERNVGLIWHVYLEDVRESRNFMGEPADVIQAGRIGLWRAAKEYRPSMGFQFSTIACKRIGWSMFAEIKAGRVVYVPPTAFKSEHQRTRRRAWKARRVRRLVELRREVWERSDDGGFEAMERDDELRHMRSEVDREMAHREVRQSEIYFARADGLTWQQIAEQHGITRERVRQILERTLCRIKMGVRLR